MGRKEEMAHQEKVLVTGALGLCGAAIAAEASKHWPVRKTDVLPGPDIMTADLRRLSEVRRVVEGMDVVCHLGRASTRAGATPPEDPDEQRQWTFDVNLFGTLNLLEACTDAGVRRLVFASSVGAIAGYPKDAGITEADPPRPERGPNPYQITKWLGEELCRYYAEHHAIEAVALRIFGIVADDPPDYRKLAEWADYDRIVHLRDVVQAFVRSVDAELPSPFEIFHVVADVPQGRWPCDKAKRILGYRPAESFREFWPEDIRKT